MPATIPPFLEINHLTPAQYAGAVSFAMEAMRLVYGEMSEADEQRFEAKWNPLFEFCTTEVLDYFNKLNPLLGQFLGIRAAMSETIVAFDEAQLEAASALAAEDPEAVLAALDLVAVHRVTLESLDAAMTRVVQAILALGEPPDAAGLRKKRREDHDRLLGGLLRGEGEAVSLSWGLPPPGWGAMASWSRVGVAFPTDARERYVFLNPERSYLQFRADEDPGFAMVLCDLRWEPYPELSDVRPEDQRSLFANNYPDIVPGSFRADKTRVARCDALHFEWDAGSLQSGGSLSARHFEWYAVDLGMNDQNCWLRVQVIMVLDANGELVNEGPLAAVFSEEAAAKRHQRRWKAYRDLWDPEVQQIVGDLRVSFAPGIPPEEAKRFPYRESWDLPEAEREKIFGTKSCGRPQAANGTFALVAVDGGDEAGAHFTAQVAGVDVRSDHRWTPLPRTLRAGEEVEIKLDVQVLPNPELDRQNIELEASTEAQAYFTYGQNPPPERLQITALTPEKGGRTRSAGSFRFVVDAVPTLGFQKAVITVTNLLSRPGVSFLGEKEVKYHYLWDWAPTRHARPQAEAAPVAQVTDEELTDRKARQAQIDFYRSEIAVHEERIAALQKQLKEAPLDSAAEIDRSIMTLEDWLQKARDQIAYLETGQYTRTRTRSDAFNFSIMAARGREMADKWSTLHRLAERGMRLIAQAPYEEQENLRRFLSSQLTPETIAAGDAEKFRDVARIIGNRVVGSLEREAAVAEEQAVAAADRLQRIENLKAVCDTGMLVLSMGGGPLGWGYNAYLGATGYIEGGVGEAAKRVLSMYNTATRMASAAIDAYTQAVLAAYQEQARDPARSPPVDEVRAGLIGAAWAVGKQVALMAAMKYVVQPLTCRILGVDPNAPPPPKKTLKELNAEMQFIKRQLEGRDTVELFRTKMSDIAKAGAAGGGGGGAIDRLRQEAEVVYRLIKTDYHAKMYLNKLARAGDTQLVRQFNVYDRYAMDQLKQVFQRKQAESGLSFQEYRCFSNSASAGKVGIDIDLGVVEPPRFILKDGQQIANPARAEWLRSLVQTTDGGRTRLGVHQFREIGQKNLEAAFTEVYGYSPKLRAGRESFVNFTTSDHPEAYRDLAWLGRKGMKTADIANVDPAWAQQAASVTGFKVNDLPHHHPSFGYYSTLQEQCRGLVKDFDTKLIPLTSRATNPKAVETMKQLREVMDRFARDEIGPTEANRTIMNLTGGRGVAEVTERYSVMLQALARKR